MVCYIGGLVAYNSGTIINSYASGHLSSATLVGGLVAENYGGEINGSFWNITTSGLGYSDGGCGLTETEMNKKETFIEAGWNMDFVWICDNVKHPKIEVNFTFKPVDKNNNGALDITSINDLRWLSETGDGINSNWELVADIDASQTNTWGNGAGFIPILYFLNSFDGNCFTIKNLHINLPCKDYVGLFEYLYTEYCSIKNLNLSNMDITGEQYVGGLSGKNYNGLISNINISGNFRGKKYVGGVIGDNSTSYVVSNICTSGKMEYNDTYNSWNCDYMGGLFGINHSSIINSMSSIEIEGNHMIGGLFGEGSGTVFNSYFIGNIEGHDLSDNIGGLIGNCTKGNISNCYVKSDITGTQQVGGAVGTGSKDVTIVNTYFFGNINSKRYVGGICGYWSGILKESCAYVHITNDSSECYISGGLVGKNYYGTIENSFARGSICGKNYIGGLVGSNVGGEIFNSYSSVLIESQSYTGGLIGLIKDGIQDSKVTNSFWDIQTSKIDSSAGGSGLPTTDMKMKSTFTDATWDFDSIWAISPDINDGYPYLQDMEFVVSVKENPGQAPQTGINVYPNPADEYVILELNGSPAKAFEIRNLEGRLIQDGNLTGAGNPARIYIGEIPAGYYFIRVICSDEMLSYPLLVE